MRHYKFKNNLK